jgi:hypothetical protein
MDAGRRAINCFGRQPEQIWQLAWRPQEVEEVSRRVGGGVCTIPCPGGYRTVDPIAYRFFDQARVA